MSQIFISYFHEDRANAAVLASALEAEGLSVWWDRTIEAGENFDQVIEEALSAANVVIVLWSLKAVKSRWVLNEAEEAAARHILVPVLIEAGIRIPLAFKRIQAANLVGWDGSPQAPEFRDLVASLMHRVGSRSGIDQPPATAPFPVDGPVAAPDPPARPVWSPMPRFLYRRVGLTSLLVAVFVVNFIETMAEVKLRSRYGVGTELGYQIAAAFRGFEGDISFDSHDATNWLAIYGYSVAYFFLLPMLGLGMIAVLSRRARIEGYRVLCLAIAADYLISLAFFVFFPVPERWAFSESGAMLLSDRWSSWLVELVRPISGLDNCFPSSHVSLTVVIVLVGYLFHVRMRHTILCLGAIIILSTFALGIHWIPDILAGVAVAFLSVALSRRLTPLPRLATAA